MLARRLQALGWLTAQAVRQVDVLWCFGRLIGHSDMHTGNLGFVPRAGGFEVAPACDMLPMAHAPRQ